MVGLGNVDNIADINKTFAQSQITGLTSTISSLAPLSGPTFTGTVTIPTLVVTGNLTTNGSYGAYLKCLLSTTTYGTTQTDVLWSAPVFSYGLVGPSNSAAIKFTSAGVYAVYVQLHSNTTISTAKDFQLQLFYSTNGTTYTDYENSEVYLPYTSGAEEFYLNGLIQAATNSYIKVQVLNNTGANIVFNSGGQWSYLHVYRVG